MAGLYAKLYGRVSSHRKFRRAGLEAVGLWSLSLAYAAENLTDGHVDGDWFEELVPNRKRRERLLATLVEHQLAHPNGTGYVVHDYLEHNMSRSTWEARRQSRAEAGRKGGATTRG
jgi:hypothetical protein